MRRRCKYNRENRPKLSEDELLSYLKEHNFRSELQLRRGRKPGEPTDNDYIKQFGSWSNTIKRAFGDESFLSYDPYDKNYHIKCVIEFDLWDVKRYLEVRKKNKDIIPSLHIIIRVWKRFSNLNNAATDVNVRRINERYYNLWLRVGRRPTPDEVTGAGIVLDKAIKFFGGKWKLDEYIERLVRVHNERKAGSA